MKVTFFGAAGEVTGSCYLVESERARVLVDCGLFQGSERVERMNKIPKDLMPKHIDAVVLTHAHLDHTGRLPLLVKTGYTGPVYCTHGTQDFAKLILADAAKIQGQDTERLNRNRRRMGQAPVEPLYEPRDVEFACKQMRTLEYNKPHEIADGVAVELVEAGHILGSSTVILDVDSEGSFKRAVFSGDLGAYGVPIMRDPEPVETADAVFVESTYGDRDHRSLKDTIAEFKQIIKDAVERRGKVLIPTFAVGRAQQILYYLAEMFREGSVQPFPIYLDSPMAIAATELYAKHERLMDEDAGDFFAKAKLRKELATLIPCQSADESRALNNIEGPCVILAGAGMCNAGRILHHLRHNLPSPNTNVVIVGYQARGSLGRQLIEGEDKVRIFGETIQVRAKVATLGGFSAHAGQTDLLRWLGIIAGSKPRIFVTHGEDIPRRELAYKIEEKFAIKAELPKMGETSHI